MKVCSLVLIVSVIAIPLVAGTVHADQRSQEPMEGSRARSVEVDATHARLEERARQALELLRIEGLDPAAVEGDTEVVDAEGAQAFMARIERSADPKAFAGVEKEIGERLRERSFRGLVIPRAFRVSCAITQDVLFVPGSPEAGSDWLVYDFCSEDEEEWCIHCDGDEELCICTAGPKCPGYRNC